MGTTATATSGHHVLERGLPKAQDAPRPGGNSGIKYLGTQAPAAGWTYAQAAAYARRTNGGNVPLPNLMDEKNGAIGKLDAQNNIVEFLVGVYPTSFTAWMECSYVQPDPNDNKKIIQKFVSSSLEPVTVK